MNAPARERSPVDVVVVLPARDEAGSIGDVVAGLIRAGLSAVVVDNGSRDGTADVARTAGAIVVAEPRPGYGRACLRGVAEARRLGARLVGFMDADGSDPPEELARLAPLLEERDVDLVLGVRRRGTEGHAAMPPAQRFGNWLAPWLMRALFGAPFSDMPSMKLLRAEHLHAMALRDEDYGFTIELLLEAHRRGLRTLEEPVAYRARTAGVSKVSGSLRASAKAGAKILYKIALHARRVDT